MTTSDFAAARPLRSPDAQRHVFWASYMGWLLDGFDSTIYAFVLAPALSFLLPNSGIAKSALPTWGLNFFAIFLVGWGTSFLIGPLADRIGRMRALGLSILLYAVGTLASGLAMNVSEFALARFVTGLGLGAEWFIGGTGVSEVIPEERRERAAGRFHSAWYAGFILAAVITPFLAPVISWRGVFFIGVAPALLLGYIRVNSLEPEAWQRRKNELDRRMTVGHSLRTVFDRAHARQTIILTLIMVPVITGLYGGTLFVPTAITLLAKSTHAGLAVPYLVAIAGVVISAFTFGFCFVMPHLARRWGRKPALAMFLGFMAVGMVVVFQLAFKANDLVLFILALPLLGIGGADFSVFSLWLPELYPTEARAGGFGVVTALGRYVGAALTFAIAAMNTAIGLPNSLSVTAAFFLVGLALLPLARETKGSRVPL